MIASYKSKLWNGFFAVVVIQLFSFSLITQAVAQSKCETAVTDAQEMYDIGRSADVIVLISHCLPDSIPQTEKVRAYRLLALSYLAEDFDSEARVAVNKLLDLNKNFEPDPTQDDARFIKQVEEENEIRAQKKSKRKKWFFIGGGVVLAGVTTAIITAVGGGTPRERLPDPPVFPDDQ